ncbi:hypothetical protein A5672_15705 [Mycobacterium alsense]|uniref:Cyclase n=1 Tax=Mycobacterium alsense TaxID=324058 RepID=A0ABD6P4B6_9MYCO|nr:BTAD domain-containing putative transcriptional regulator [Mycobacterium alsense]OBG39011.1 hypothetical protein A5672_15705 [Mycobacterium alsense]
MELGVLGPLQVRQHGVPVAIPGAKPRAILTMLGLHGGSLVPAEALVELLWGDDPPRTAAKALQTHISALRRSLGDGFVLTQGVGWALAEADVDASRYTLAARLARDAAAAGDTTQAVARFEEALGLWRGPPELPDGRRGTSEKTRWIEGHAALVEDRADALLATGRAAEIIGELEAAVAEAPLRERRWGQLMLALYRVGRQGEALSAYQRARAQLADDLGVDPGPELRRLEAAIVAQDSSLDALVTQRLPSVTRAVTFLLTDIEGSTAAWEANAGAMAVALARHDELVEQVVTSRGGRLIKTRGEGDATFSVFERPSAAAAAAIELQDAIGHEPWAPAESMRIRVALHTGEAELRDGDYFGRAVNRAARLRSLADGGQILCSGATAELVIDTLPDDVALTDLGMRQLRNLPRPEHVFELRLQPGDSDRPEPQPTDAPIERPALPAVLVGPGPFVGRGRELQGLLSAWQTALSGGLLAVLIAGEPGVGKTRLAGEWSRRAYEQGAIVLYGRCDEDLGAPYQPFAEALRALVPCVGPDRLRGLRGVEGLLPLVPGLTEVLPDVAAPTRADPDTERYALFDAVVALLGIASAAAPVVLILDDLHWAAKPTLLLLRHLLRFGEHARVQIIGTYRSTDLDRSHPLAAMLADLHRDGTADRVQLSGLDEDDVTAYVAEAGYDDEELARALAAVTGGNPFFLIEALRHVDESGGRWDPSTLPQGVREAVSRRLSRLGAETNKALAAAAVVGSRFALELVERVVDDDLVDAFDEACKAGIVIEEPGGRYRFNHALVRQSLLAELPSVRRMRLHQRIAATLEDQPGAEDELLAELAYHYFECAWAGNAAKAVEYCRRAADQAMARLAYEGAAELYDRALHALEEIDDELSDRDDQVAALLIARCEALLAAGDVASAADAVPELQRATADSARLAAWAACFDGELSMLIHPERLDEAETAVGAAAAKLAQIADAAGEAKAHTVRAGCLARLGRIGDCEMALDDALTAARRAGEHRRVNAVLANAPLAALWGPNPVPRAGGRCLDVVRLLRITTDSPAVEATSTRCQAVLEAFRGRAAAARRMIESARRTVTELGLRHALSEVEQFAGIVELIANEPAAAETHLRKAYNGFRRMGLDADTAETAALLGRTCLALDRDAEAGELCSESGRLAGHALKASIAWRTLRALLLSRRGEHEEARHLAEAAVTLAERTDALVDHGDACLALATVLGNAGDATGARSAAQRAVDLYARKGAAALAERARSILGGCELPPAPLAAQPEPQAQSVELNNACVRAISRLDAAYDDDDWEEIERNVAAVISTESRRKIVGLSLGDLPYSEWESEARRYREGLAAVRYRHVILAVRGDRLALTRLEVGTADVSPGAPRDELLQLYGIDDEGRVCLQVWFDVDDMDAALAELDARFEAEHPRSPLENAASRADQRFNELFAKRHWDDYGALLADDIRVEDRRRGLRREGEDRNTELAELRAIADVGVQNMTSHVVAIRGECLALVRTVYSGRDQRPEAFHTELFRIAELDADERITTYVAFDLDDFDAALAKLESRYLAGEGKPYASTWSVITGTFASISKSEFPAMSADCVTIDHRRATAFAPGELPAYLRAGWDVGQDITAFVNGVHRLNEQGAVVSYAAHAISHDRFDGEWHEVALVMVDGATVNRCELFQDDDLHTAIASFDRLTRPRLENTASRVYERVKACFAARDWAGIAEKLADAVSTEDRRRVVNTGLRQGKDAVIAEISALAEVGMDPMSDVVATRGERLVLSRVRISGHDQGPEVFHSAGLDVLEIDAEERVVARVVFDLEDLDSAIAELDSRYLAGEAAAHARTWSVIASSYAALNRSEPPLTMPDCVNIDHRREAAFGPGDLTAYMRAGLELDPNVKVYVRQVHRLTSRGAVITYAAHETSQSGFDAEWCGVAVFTIEGEMINRTEVFDETKIDAAIERFRQLSRPAPPLENAASQQYERFKVYFAAHEWAAIAEMLADNVSTEDRRRVVNSGLRQGHDAVITELSGLVDVVKAITSEPVATRGERLLLNRARTETYEAFQTDFLDVVEVDPEGRVVARVVFDPEDFDAALAELDARYLAGEAVAYSRTWSVVAQTYAAANRHELLLSPDCVTIDHRQASAFVPGEFADYMRATWDLAPNVWGYVETVHRLSRVGAVVTRVVSGTSKEGFDAEWREVILGLSEGDRINRCELFDEEDLEAALARFDELQSAPRRLENAATQAFRRFITCFTTRDWTAMAATMADAFCSHDHRRVVNASVLRGRDANIASVRAVAEAGFEGLTSNVIAIRGQRLALARIQSSASGFEPGEIIDDMLDVCEIDAGNRLVAGAIFDIDDVEAAFAELDGRYLAGEAAAHADAWSVLMRVQTAYNRHEVSPTTTDDWVNIDHRRGRAFMPGDLIPFLHATWNVAADVKGHFEEVHRLNSVGAVITEVVTGTSRDGFDFELREIGLFAFEGNLVSRFEMFDEADLDAALARFEELQPPPRRLENAATRAHSRVRACVAARDWDALTEILADNIAIDDRRRTVNSGIQHGRDAAVADMRGASDLGLTDISLTVVATRGGRLELSRTCIRGQDHPEAFRMEFVSVVEIDADERIVARVAFDAEDLDAAFEELDARYLSGEAAAHAQTWSVVSGSYAAMNRRELFPTTPDWVNVDRRRHAILEEGGLNASLRSLWELVPDIKFRVEAVHRLTDLGAVTTHVAQGVSQDGFHAEWRGVEVQTVDGELISRCEIFDDADLDAAIARFEELQQQARLPKNAATLADQRFWASFDARDWDAMAQLLTDDVSTDDRRRVVNAGMLHGRDVHIESMRVLASFEANMASSIIATRGERLALTHLNRDLHEGDFGSELLYLIEIDADHRLARGVHFDPDDIAAAFEELDARYLAGEAAAHARTWSAIVGACTALSRGELFPTTPNWVNIDHRRGIAFTPGDLTAYIRTAWNLLADGGVYIESAHRLGKLGAVVTWAGYGTSREGADIEFRGINLLTVEGDLINRCEIFDDSDLDAALARFDELE